MKNKKALALLLGGLAVVGSAGVQAGQVNVFYPATTVEADVEVEVEVSADAHAPAAAEARAAAEVEAMAESEKALLSGEKKKPIVIKLIEAGGEDADIKEKTWLGVGLAEPDEALVSQLGLKDGVGLLVTYVAQDSPAAKAGLQKNDVLLEMEGQTLVVTAQLQKLVQARKEGEKVTLKYLRGGKKDNVTVTLGKTKMRTMMAEGDNSFVWQAGKPGEMGVFGAANVAHGDQMVMLKKALEAAKVDQQRVQVEVRRSVDEARRAMEEALRTTSQTGSMREMHRELEALAKAGVFVPNDATVTVRSSGKSSKSMVKADDAGTIVLVKNPKLRLTAHDKDGKLLFDGEIENAEQREKVPADLWKKVQPLVEKFSPGADE